MATLFLASFADVRAAVANDLNKVASFNIPAQPLDKALLEFGLQAHMQIMFAWDPTIGRLRSHLIEGRYTLKQALSNLLDGTRLRYSARGNTVTIAPDRPRPASTPDPAPDNGSADRDSGKVDGQRGKSKAQEKHEILEEVTVTGTYIRGAAPIGSPLIVYSREDIEQSGAATIEDFARQIPENFAGADNLTSGVDRATQQAIFDQTGNNIYGGSAFNLNGMGPSATLTLLNGHRLAPGGGDGSFVDVSLIPLSAVERIEILPDGASAIYGSDAVAGVVNIITRKNFDGAESNVSYGEATAGGAAETIGSQLLGKSWASGNLMMTYEYDRQAGLDASQRDFIPDQGGSDSIVPANWRNSVLISGNQDIGSNTSLSGDAIYSTKRFHSEFTVLPTGESDFYDNRDRATQAGVSMTLHRALVGDWAVDVTGYYSRTQQTSAATANFAFAGGFVVNDTSLINTDTRLAGVNLLVQGSILELPGGDLKAAIGGSFEGQRFVSGTSTFGTDNVVGAQEDASRNEGSVYGELVIPIIGSSNVMAWAHSLQLSVAAREDRYSSFGSTVVPKLGLAWSPLAGFNLRATYGSSYRAPLLSQLASPVAYVAEEFPDAASASGLTDTLYSSGGNRDLRPERSRSFSLGPELEMHGLAASITYFHTHYVDRVGTPPLASILTVLTDPVDAPFVTRNPSPAIVDAAFASTGFEGDYAGLGPSGVGAIFDSRFTNLATTTQSSVDLRVSYRGRTTTGVWAPSIAVDRQIRNELRASPASSQIALLDLYGEPVRWKAHGGLAWTRGPYGAAVTVNFVSGYQDQFTTPWSAISSWTTADVHMSYRIPDSTRYSLLRGVSLGLTVENITDERPPYVAFPPAVTGGAPPIPYDPANASPVGRFVSLQVNKRWAQ